MGGGPETRQPLRVQVEIFRTENFILVMFIRSSKFNTIALVLVIVLLQWDSSTIRVDTKT